MDEKHLILVFVKGHWIPFKNIDQWKDYYLKFKESFKNIEDKDIRVFDACFVELKSINYEN